MIRMIKKLTLLCSLLCSWEIFSTTSLSDIIFSSEDSATFLRWNFFVERESLVIEKNGNVLTIGSLNQAILAKIVEEMQSISLSKKFFVDEKVYKDASTPTTIHLNLKNGTESFSFYREKEHKYVVDFWIDGDVVEQKSSAIEKKLAQNTTDTNVENDKIEKTIPTSHQALPTSSPSQSVTIKGKLQKVSEMFEGAKNIESQANDLKMRDFRYGAPFIWDYMAIAPQLKNLLNIKTKTPEHFFPILDRETNKSEQDAHLQLTINFYRKKNWGLMYKSITLFEKKYGANNLNYSEIHEYLKANALLRKNLDSGDANAFKVALTMLASLGEKTRNYDMQKAILLYLLHTSLERKDHVQSLQIAKKLYVATRENFDIEDSGYAAEVMLASLAHLEQLKVIEDLLKELASKKLINAQTILSYRVYSLVKTNKNEDAIKLYEQSKSAFVGTVDSTILFNVAEAYFRVADYTNAFNLFEAYVKNYSHITFSGAARVRMALCAELLDRDFEQVGELYKTAINRAQNYPNRFEAQIRYVAFRSVRNKYPSESDLETRIFLDREDDKRANLSKDIMKLLWIVRLRTFIVDQKFEDALAYLSAIPIRSLKPAEIRSFESDGAEIIEGILLHYYKNADYGNVIKMWELYKNKYVEKVALDPFINFLAGDSYLKMAMYDKLDRLITDFDKLKGAPVRSYAVWHENKYETDPEILLQELRVKRHIALKNWNVADKEVVNLTAKSSKNKKSHYYNGIILYNKKDYTNSSIEFEKFLTESNRADLLGVGEVADLIDCYTDAIYKLKDSDKYIKVSKAILEDTKNQVTNNEYMTKVKEKVAYLLIETMSEKNSDADRLLLETYLKDFRQNFKESIYEGRILYMLGVTLIKNQKKKEGQEILGELLGNEKASEHIKQMARAELSLMEIKDRML